MRELSIPSLTGRDFRPLTPDKIRARDKSSGASDAVRITALVGRMDGTEGPS
jgi:hypothetical protein